MRNANRKLFALGAMLGGTGLSIALASVPHHPTFNEETAISQALSEIHIQKEHAPNFDGDIQRLSNLEVRYHDRLRKPMQRVSKQSYQPSSRVKVNSKTYRP
ncbi:MAG: hypothetical protein P4M08_03840 [Oligoflexia bacterium]|nr:hypothetical protein [Oligoflexia bacterium]